MVLDTTRIRPSCAGAVRAKPCADVYDQSQLCSSAQPNPTLELTLTLALSLWGARGRQEQPRGSAACFGGVFPKKLPGGRKTGLDQSETRSLHKVLCIGRAHHTWVWYTHIYIYCMDYCYFSSFEVLNQTPPSMWSNN